MATDLFKFVAQHPEFLAQAEALQVFEENIDDLRDIKKIDKDFLLEIQDKIFEQQQQKLHGEIESLKTQLAEANENMRPAIEQGILDLEKQLMLAAARAEIGTPYMWGGRATAKNPGFDCMGLTWKALGLRTMPDLVKNDTTDGFTQKDFSGDGAQVLEKFGQEIEVGYNQDEIKGSLKNLPKNVREGDLLIRGFIDEKGNQVDRHIGLIGSDKDGNATFINAAGYYSPRNNKNYGEVKEEQLKDATKNFIDWTKREQKRQGTELTPFWRVARLSTDNIQMQAQT